jgi:hypothetical protein
MDGNAPGQPIDHDNIPRVISHQQVVTVWLSLQQGAVHPRPNLARMGQVDCRESVFVSVFVLVGPLRREELWMVAILAL